MIVDQDLAAIMREPEGDWLARTPPDQLFPIVARLLDVGRRAVAGRRSDLADNATRAAVPAGRLLFERLYVAAGSMVAARPEAVSAYLLALNGRAMALAAANRPSEAAEVHVGINAITEQVAGLTRQWRAAAGSEAEQVVASLQAGLEAAAKAPAAAAPETPAPVVAAVAELAAARERAADAAGDPVAARAAQEELVSALERTVTPDAPELADELNRLAQLCWQLGDNQAALAAAQRSVAVHDRSGLAPTAATVRDLTLLGSIHVHLASLPAALAVLERAQAAAEHVYGTERVEFARSLSYLGTVQSDLGHLPAAAAAQQRALAILERELGPEHRETLFVTHSHGRTLRRLGDLRGAIAAQRRAETGYLKALATYARTLPPGHPLFARTSNRLDQVRQELAELPSPRAAA